MLEIPLTQGKNAIIDDEDYSRISGYSWFTHRERNQFYAWAYAGGGRKRREYIRMHQLILARQGTVEVDHINGDGLDNRRHNLRYATRHQNSMNMRKHSHGSSRFKGVCWDRNTRGRKKWLAQITSNYKRIFLGRYLDEEQAARAYDEAALRHFKQFARLNFPAEMAELVRCLKR